MISAGEVPLPKCTSGLEALAVYLSIHAARRIAQVVVLYGPDSPTHHAGHLLDVFITRMDSPVSFKQSVIRKAFTRKFVVLYSKQFYLLKSLREGGMPVNGIECYFLLSYCQ
jgi:hypothetical protein